MRDIEPNPKSFKVVFDPKTNSYVSGYWSPQSQYELVDNFKFTDDLKYINSGIAKCAIFESFFDKRKFHMTNGDFTKLLLSGYPNMMGDQLYFSGRYTFCKKGKRIFIKALDIK